MTEPTVKFTYQDYLQLPEDKRYELVEGEFYMVPSPSWDHQTVLKKLFRILDDYVSEKGLGEVRFAPLDVLLSEDNVVQPDILFISRERLDIVQGPYIQGAPDLVIEILSPSTAARDQELKRKLYAKYGVREYWIVDPGEKAIRVMASGAGDFRLTGSYEAGSSVDSPSLADLSFDPGDVF